MVAAASTGPPLAALLCSGCRQAYHPEPASPSPDTGGPSLLLSSVLQSSAHVREFRSSHSCCAWSLRGTSAAQRYAPISRESSAANSKQQAQTVLELSSRRGPQLGDSDEDASSQPSRDRAGSWADVAGAHEARATPAQAAGTHGSSRLSSATTPHSQRLRPPNALTDDDASCCSTGGASPEADSHATVAVHEARRTANVDARRGSDATMSSAASTLSAQQLTPTFARSGSARSSCAASCLHWLPALAVVAGCASSVVVLW